jgi:hypothetical protein
MFDSLATILLYETCSIWDIGLLLLLMILGYLCTQLFFLFFTGSRKLNDMVCCISRSED